MKNAIIIIVLVILADVSLVSAQPPDTLWTKLYGADNGYCVKQTQDGGYIVTGYKNSISNPSSCQFYIIRTNQNGDTLWTRAYGNTSINIGHYIEQINANEFIAVGSKWVNGADVWLLKLNENGDTLWTKTYGGGNGDEGYYVQQTNDNGYIIVGLTCSNSIGGMDIWLLKTDANGDTLWTKKFGGIYNDIGTCVRQTSDGGYIITGCKGTQELPLIGDLWIIKTDAYGDTLWTKTYGDGGDNIGESILETSYDEGYVIVGTICTPPFGFNCHDIWLLKTDSNGDTLWTQKFNNGGDDTGWDIKLTNNGYIIVGSSPVSISNQGWIIKTNLNGIMTWSMLIGGNYEDCLFSIDLTNDGGYIATGGYGLANSFELSQLWLVKIVTDDRIISAILTPHNPPIHILPGGGSFQFNLDLVNNGSISYIVDVWTDITYIGGRVFPIIQRNNINLPPFGYISRNNLTQYIPASALPGEYTYNVHVRDHNTGEILAENSFSFYKYVGNRIDFVHDLGWTFQGWDDETKLTQPPTEFALYPANPNPFNPSTNISFSLPEASQISLNIYNTQGQLVTNLGQGYYQAGKHQLSFNAQQLPCGIYFAKLTTNNHQQTQKLLLLK